MSKTEKRQRFEKVAGNRVQKILDTLQLLKNCSNRNNYEYSESDVEFMFSEILKGVKVYHNMARVYIYPRKDTKQLIYRRSPTKV